jgi:glyoxylase-like metal-dependent hydrolase (beta-lactamase superfamily II)
MALQEVLSATGAESLAHPADAPEIPVVTSTLTEGDTVTVGDCTLEVIHLVGHTPGSIALYYAPEGGHLFTGDSLFPGGVGNTHGNKADFDSLFHDVTTKLFDRLPDDVTFYPGHGRNSTLGTERPSIPEWRARGW